MFHGQRINLYFVIIKIYKLYGIFHFVCNTPPILLAREKIPAPLPTRGRQGGRCGPAGGRRARKARTKQGQGGPKAPCPCFGLAGRGGRRPPRPPNAAAPPGRCGFLLPYRFPTLFPFCNPPYPKSLLETAEGGFQGRAIRSPQRSTPYTLCIPGSGPRPFHPPTSAPQLLRGLGAEPPPAGVQGRGRPWPWRSQFPYALRRPPFYRTLHKPLLLRHEKGPANAGPFRLSKKWLAPLFRGFHSSLAPTARPGSYARKPLLRKAFCGFDAHVAKSDQSLRGLRPPNPRGFFDRLKGPANAGPFNLFFVLFTR